MSVLWFGLSSERNTLLEGDCLGSLSRGRATHGDPPPGSSHMSDLVDHGKSSGLSAVLKPRSFQFVNPLGDAASVMVPLCFF